MRQPAGDPRGAAAARSHPPHELDGRPRHRAAGRSPRRRARRRRLPARRRPRPRRGDQQHAARLLPQGPRSALHPGLARHAAEEDRLRPAPAVAARRPAVPAPRRRGREQVGLPRLRARSPPRPCAVPSATTGRCSRRATPATTCWPTTPAARRGGAPGRDSDPRRGPRDPLRPDLPRRRHAVLRRRPRANGQAPGIDRRPRPRPQPGGRSGRPDVPPRVRDVSGVDDIRESTSPPTCW